MNLQCFASCSSDSVRSSKMRIQRYEAMKLWQSAVVMVALHTHMAPDCLAAARDPGMRGAEAPRPAIQKQLSQCHANSHTIHSGMLSRSLQAARRPGDQPARLPAGPEGRASANKQVSDS
jgi:hypothetical protein